MGINGTENTLKPPPLIRQKPTGIRDLLPHRFAKVLTSAPWAALAVVVISAVFLGAIASALARGLTIDCGCFGGGVPSRVRMWLDLGRDLVLLAAALLTYLHYYGSRLAE